MKQIVSNYSYSPATNVVTLTGVNIDADQLLLIVAPGVGRTMYNFASVTGTVSAGADTRVTLNASTAGLTTTSPLVIFYDDQGSTQTVAGTVTVGGFSGVSVESGALLVGGLRSSSIVPIPLDSGTGQVGVQLKQSSGASVDPISQTNGLWVRQANNSTITVGNSVTIGSLPAISGTVTANVSALNIDTGFSGSALFGVSGQDVNAVRAVIYSSANSDFGSDQGAPVDSSNPLPVTGAVAVNGSVTASSNLNAFAEGTFQRVGGYPIGSEGTARLSLEVNGPAGVGLPSVSGIPAVPIAGTVTVSNSVTIGSLPAISGTVTANSIFPRVTLIDGSGTVTTANTAITVFASSSTRSYLLVQVTTGSAFVNVGATATTVNGINLTAGQGYSWETTIPQGIVSLISTTTNSRYVAKEA